MEKQYYTAEEAIKILNVPKSTFYKEVEMGNIPKFLEKGHKRGMKFPKEAIDIHARMLQQANEIHRTFARATNADIWTIIEHHKELYDEEYFISYRKAIEWKEINHEIFMIMKDGDEISGAVAFVPLADDITTSLLKDKIRERNIPAWAIRKWTDTALSVYIPRLSTFPTGNQAVDKGRARSILRFAIRWALSLNKQYDIKSWYAIAATSDGKDLLEALGFQRLQETQEGYVLNGLNQSIPLIKHLLEHDEQERQLPLAIQTRNKQR